MTTIEIEETTMGIYVYVTSTLGSFLGQQRIEVRFDSIEKALEYIKLLTPPKYLARVVYENALSEKKSPAEQAEAKENPMSKHYGYGHKD